MKDIDFDLIMQARQRIADMITRLEEKVQIFIEGFSHVYRIPKILANNDLKEIKQGETRK